MMSLRGLYLLSAKSIIEIKSEALMAVSVGVYLGFHQVMVGGGVGSEGKKELPATLMFTRGL